MESERFGEDITLSDIEPRFLGRPARGLLIVLTELSQLRSGLYSFVVSMYQNKIFRTFTQSFQVITSRPHPTPHPSHCHLQ